jgi:hypothetical protein
MIHPQNPTDLQMLISRQRQNAGWIQRIKSRFRSWDRGKEEAKKEKEECARKPE